MARRSGVSANAKIEFIIKYVAAIFKVIFARGGWIVQGIAHGVADSLPGQLVDIVVGSSLLNVIEDTRHCDQVDLISCSVPLWAHTTLHQLLALGLKSSHLVVAHHLGHVGNEDTKGTVLDGLD